MNNIVILNKNSYEILVDKTLLKNSMYNSKEFNQSLYANIINIVKNLDETSLSLDYIIKLDSKAISYRRSKDSYIALFIICEKKYFKKDSLSDMGRIFMEYLEKLILEKNEITNNKKFFDFKIKEIINQIISDLTIKYIEFLRKNKLYCKFIYFNYNPNVVNSLQYKKTKLDSTSVILYQSSKENEKLVEQKDTMLQKSTIKEKELNLEYEKKSLPPTDRRIFIKKFNQIKPETIRKKNLVKNFDSNSFIEKYFLANNSMIHCLFNNIFMESNNNLNNSILREQASDNNKGFLFPISGDNEHILLYLIDLYEKSQNLFSVNKVSTSEYVDIANYVEINLSKPDVMLTKSKLIIIKHKYLFLIFNIEIYDDKNMWSSINANTNFYKEIENLFSVVFTETYSGIE